MQLSLVSNVRFQGGLADDPVDVLASRIAATQREKAAGESVLVTAPSGPAAALFRRGN
jgi:hypothetical protein